MEGKDRLGRTDIILAHYLSDNYIFVLSKCYRVQT